MPTLTLTSPLIGVPSAKVIERVILLAFSNKKLLVSESCNVTEKGEYTETKMLKSYSTGVNTNCPVEVTFPRAINC